MDDIVMPSFPANSEDFAFIRVEFHVMSCRTSSWRNSECRSWGKSKRAGIFKLLVDLRRDEWAFNKKPRVTHVALNSSLVTFNRFPHTNNNNKTNKTETKLSCGHGFISTFPLSISKQSIVSTFVLLDISLNAIGSTHGLSDKPLQWLRWPVVIVKGLEYRLA